MRTAKAKPISKPKPGSIESLRRKVADLEIATALVKGAKMVERELTVPNTPINPVPSDGRALEWEMQLVELGRRVPDLLEELSNANTALTDAKARFNEIAPLPPKPRLRAKEGPKRIFKRPILKIVRGPPEPPTSISGPMEVMPAYAYQMLRDSMARNERDLARKEIYQVSDQFQWKFMEAAADCGLAAALTRAQTASNKLRDIASQAFCFKPKTRLGIAAQAIAIYAADIAGGGRGGSKFYSELAINLLEVEALLNPAFADAFGQDLKRPQPATTHFEERPT